MPTVDSPKIKLASQSTSFQQMCSFAAIADTRSPDESVRELILHTLSTFDGEKFTTAPTVSRTLLDVFGVEIPNHQIQEALDQLMTDGQIHKPLGTNYVLTTSARTKVQTRIDQSAKLQERVRDTWKAEISKQFVELEFEMVWSALQEYLAHAFLRHGIQVVAFLNPSVDLPEEYATSLSTLLDKVVKSKFDMGLGVIARAVISGFVASAGRNSDRAQYIAECADGAFNYFSLSVSPDVASGFQEQLSRRGDKFVPGLLGQFRSETTNEE